MCCVQGAVTFDTPYSLTEDGIAYKDGKLILKLAEWQTMHDRFILLKGLNAAYQTGYSEGWKDRKN